MPHQVLKKALLKKKSKKQEQIDATRAELLGYVAEQG